jgi:anthranilate 1,2-dioxygenase small subunit
MDFLKENTNTVEYMLQHFELATLQDRYIASIDHDRLEDWPKFFTPDCLYEIISKENEDLNLPAPVIYCDNAAMLRDRVLSLRNANIYEKPAYRHFVSGLEWQVIEGGFSMSSSYLVVNTGQKGVSSIYQAGRYLDIVVRTEHGLRFRQKRCIYDTLRVQTLLAYPI